MNAVVKITSRFLPLLIGVIVVSLLFKLGFDYRLKNFDKVLDGSITFSSIVVGFLGALLGILISVKDSKIVTAIFNTEEKYTLKYYFNETFLLGFTVVILSCVMHVLREVPSTKTDIFFYIWSIVTTSFIPATYRIVNALMSIFFRANNLNERPDGNKLDDEKKRNELKEALKKHH